MKTILIPLFDGFIARNILYTSVIHELTKGGDIRVVIIPPKGKVEMYTAQFENNKTIFVEKGPFWIHDRFEFLVDKLFINSIPTTFMRVRQVDWYWHKHRYVMYAIARILGMLGHFQFWHYVIRTISATLPIHSYIPDILDRWKPDLIFAPTMIARDEVALMRLGRERGAKVVGMVKSWDNLTSKLFLRFFPDKLVVHNEIVAGEAYSIYGYPKESVVITGIPQYDDYLKPEYTQDREAFFKKIGADPNKKLITYAPACDWMSMHDKEILARILDWIEEGKFADVQVLLRLHPTYESQTEELSGRRHLIVERPGKHFGGNTKETMLRTVEFDVAEMQHLASTMRWSDVTINTASTMIIEAAILDAPIVLIAFDGERELPYWHSSRRYYDRDHCVPILKSGGVTTAYSYEELFKAITAYLVDPKLHAEGRERIRREQCYKLDGKSGERVAAVLTEILQKP